MDHKYIIFSCGTIKWKIEKNAPQTYNLKSNKDLTFVNPVYIDFETLAKDGITRNNKVDETNNFFHVTSNCIIFRVSKDIDIFSLIEYYESFIKKIRDVTKQTSINDNFEEVTEIDNIALLSRNKNFIEGIRIMDGIIYSTLSSMSDVIEADKQLNIELITPTYSEIFLDALDDLISRKYRKSILYSAMAMEIALTSKLDEAYKILSTTEESEKYRISEIYINKKVGKKTKDYLYEYLSGVNNFSVLLRERSLYVLGKSIAIEDDKLYKSAIKLYATRNKIVHTGNPDNLKEQINIDREGAIEAFEITRNVFNWLEITDFNKIVIKGKIKY